MMFVRDCRRTNWPWIISEDEGIAAIFEGRCAACAGVLRQKANKKQAVDCVIEL